MLTRGTLIATDAPRTDPPPLSPPRVGAVVLQYGASDVTALVRSLERHPAIAAVVVVRNPGPGTAAADDRDPANDCDPANDPGADGDDGTGTGVRARRLAMAQNVGYGIAVDAGRAEPDIAAQPLHLVLTHDVTLHDGCLDALVAALDADPRIAIAGPALVDPDSGSCTLGATRSRWGHVRHRRFTADRAAHEPVMADVAWLDGACMLLRAATVGGFDHRLFLYVEDVAICLAAAPANRVVAVRTARATQRSGMTSRPGAHAYLLARNHLLVAVGRHEPAARLLGAGRGAVSVSAHLARAVRAVATRPAVPEQPVQHALRQAAGAAWGTVDGLRGRSGPPPARLQAWGDIEVPRPSPTDRSR